MTEETGEHATNLENLLSPFCYEAETELPKPAPDVPGGLYLAGFISQDCSWGCCFNQSVVKCFPVEKYFEDNQSVNHSNNASIAISSSSHTFTGGIITCATELAIHNHRVSSGTRKLLLGISYAGGGENNNHKDPRGALVIFDPIRCGPMKWIEIPEPVTSVTVLSHFEEGGSNRPFFNETMMAMVGIAAVGLRGGSAIIVDLGLDDPQLSSGISMDARNMASFTYRLLNVNPHEYVIATKRHKAVSKRSLISIKFSNESENEMVSDDFHYCKPNGESILALHKTRVAITCIEYVPAIGSLLVGYSCGGFQIWRVSNMELQYTSEPIYLDRNIPVFGFSFQQPIDDPKNYCYVWVMYGNKSTEIGNTHVELHSLLYESKHYIDNFGYAYEDFRQCAKRMTFPLIDEFMPNDADSDSSIRANSRPIRIWSQPDSELMFCAWEVDRVGMYYLGAFDLNQWYSNQTKEYISYHPMTGLCPYWVAIPVEASDVSSVILDLRIIPKSLMRWENPHMKLDVHLYPASVSFRAICLTNSGVSAFEHFGVQEKLVRIMMKDGPSLMIQPSSLKSSFLKYGLEPVYPHVYGEHLSQKDRDRFFIFSVMLESRRTATIVRLASAWLDGSYANVGCTLDLIIDWIGSYMWAVRGLADEHWEQLLMFEDDALPPETIRFINFSNFAWKSLHRMLRILMNPSEVYSVRGLELEDIEFGLGKLVQYSAAILLMYNAKLLPEGSKGFFKNLSEYYQQRRIEAKSALEASPYIDQQYKKSHPLMIDYLMDDLLAQEDVRSEWHVEEGQPVYPPQHGGYLVNMFMWPDVDPQTVSRVFLYFLIDLNSFFNQHGRLANSEVERKVLGDIKAVIDSAGDEYQEILVFWLLDHGVQEEVLIHLKERDRLFEADGLPWCAATVALTAAGFESDVAELLLKSCPHSLARLLFSLMSSSITRYNTLAELMVTSNLGSDDTLLQEFFEISENHERLSEFIRTKSKELPVGVRDALLGFLKRANSLPRLSQLLMYYVHVHDYEKLEEEFNRVRLILRQKSLSEKDLKTWQFQETYITHLLKTKKCDVVASFLRRQSPHLVRRSNPTLTIKAIPVQGDESVFVRTPERLCAQLKLPPQIRRLKLSESVIQDPLSPLKRYAGRIQTAVTTDPDSDQDELRSRRLSRRSVAPRFSFGANRQSLGSKTLNESFQNQDRQNVTLMNTSVDLLNLLKTPAVDHRSLNKSRQSICAGFSNSMNQTVTNCFTEGAPSQSFVVHSIMKENDPTKPKVNKKVELNLDRLSIDSSDEDEANKNIFEDANDDTGSEETANERVDAEGEDFHSPGTVFDTSQVSFKSFSEKSTSETEAVGTPCSKDDDSETGESEKVNDAPSVLSVRFAEIVDSPERKDSDESECLSPEGKEDDRTIHGLSVITEQDEDEEASENVSIEKPIRSIKSVLDLSIISETIIRQDDANEEEQVFTPPKPPTKSTTPSPKQSPNKPSTPTPTELKTPEKAIIQKSPSTSPSDEKKCQTVIEPVAIRTRSASRTPTQEIQDDNQLEISASPGINQRYLRSSRSRTPTREMSEEIKVEDVSPKRRTKSSRSRTPSRDSNVDLVTDASFLESTVLPDTQSQIPVLGQRRLRSSRSGTPTREQPEEAHVEDVNIQRKTRGSRSVTPSRETASEGGDEVVSETQKQRRIKGIRARTSSSKEVSEAEEEHEAVKPSKRRKATATTLTLDLDEDEDHDEDEDTSVKRRLRSSRSRTPTREVSEQAKVEVVSPQRMTRSRRSRTPSRDTADLITESSFLESTIVPDEQPPAPAVGQRRLRSSRSRTPTRELPVETQIEEVNVQRKTRSSRSVTPSRDTASENVDETVSEASKQRRIKGIRTRTLSSKDVSEAEEEHEAAKPSKRRKATATIKLDLDEDEDNENDTARRRLRSSRSRTPTRELSEQAKVEVVSPQRVTRSRRSRTPSRDTADVNPESSFLETTIVPEEQPPAPPVGRQLRSSQSSFKIFEEEEEEDDDFDTQSIVSTRSNRSVGSTRGGRGRKRRLKYFEHEQELSTLVEDSTSDLLTEPSVLDATVVPEGVAKKQRRIKGIRPLPSTSKSTSELEEEMEAVKPSKRRKSAITVTVDIDEKEDDDDDDDAQSHISTRSSRSVSSKRSTASSTKGNRGTKGKRGRRGKSKA